VRVDTVYTLMYSYILDALALQTLQRDAAMCLGAVKLVISSPALKVHASCLISILCTSRNVFVHSRRAFQCDRSALVQCVLHQWLSTLFHVFVYSGRTCVADVAA